MKETDLAYFAGLFDGEGCISIVKSHQPTKHYHYILCLRISSIDEWLMRLWQSNFGGSLRKSIPSTPCVTSGATRKPVWIWQGWARTAVPVLEALLPYLRLKRPQAEIALKFQERVTENSKKQGKSLSSEEIAVREAQRILISNLNQRKVLGGKNE